MIKKRKGKLISKVMIQMLFVLAVLILQINAVQSCVLCISPDKCVSIENSYDGRQCAKLGQSAQNSDSALPIVKSGKVGSHSHCIKCIDIPITLKLLSCKVGTLNPTKISPPFSTAALFNSVLSVSNKRHGFKFLNSSTINPELTISFFSKIVLLI